MSEKFELLLLNAHFVSEDIAWELLLEAKDKSKEEQERIRAFLNRRIGQRKNLYIYPRKR